tara:strand:+ start:620 stop:1012 length:393 start_codon:yes stop_codon:yes gene_type:complete
MNSKMILENSIDRIDKRLSSRYIKLDPQGYFLIKVDSYAGEVVVEHFENDLDEKGRALDPETGKPIECRGKTERKPNKVFRGRSAKELGIQLTEGDGPNPISKLDHALYLGRELQKAESCLIRGEKYIQD